MNTGIPVRQHLLMAGLGAFGVALLVLGRALGRPVRALAPAPFPFPHHCGDETCTEAHP